MSLQSQEGEFPKSSHWLRMEAQALAYTPGKSLLSPASELNLAASTHNYVITCVCLSQGLAPMMRLGNCSTSEVTILIQIGEVAPRKEGQPAVQWGLESLAPLAVRRTKV